MVNQEDEKAKEEEKEPEEETPVNIDDLPALPDEGASKAEGYEDLKKEHSYYCKLV